MSKQSKIQKNLFHHKYIIPQNSIIIKINDYQEIPGDEYKRGLMIETNKGNIIISIDNERNCFQLLGSKFLETPDDIEKFIGSTILKIKSFDKKYDYGDNEENIETVLNIETNRGFISYSVYNVHNGYYSHGTLIQVFDKIIEREI